MDNYWQGLWDQEVPKGGLKVASISLALNSPWKIKATKDHFGRIGFQLIADNLDISDDIFNIAGKGTISPQEIYQLYGHDTGTKVQYEGSDVPRVVEINTTKLESLLSLQETVKVVTQFITKK